MVVAYFFASGITKVFTVHPERGMKGDIKRYMYKG